MTPALILAFFLITSTQANRSRRGLKFIWSNKFGHLYFYYRSLQTVSYKKPHLTVRCQLVPAMDAVLSNLGAIACPEGENCKNPSCPLRHNREKRVASLGLDGAEEREPSGDGPRKRRKMSLDIDEPDKSVREVLTTKKPVSPPPLKRNLQVAAQSSPSASSHLPNLSHNPPKQTNPSPTFTPTKSDSGTTPLHRSPTSIHTPVQTPIPASVKATAPGPLPAKPIMPRKPEPLNPRHLRSAPATHDFRYKALKMLHEQFTRLNDEIKKDAKADEKKLVLSAQQLIWMALDEEEKTATDKPSIYQNIIKNRIMGYKRMAPGQWRDERLAEYKRREAAATPKKLPPKLLPGQPREINTGLTPQQEVAVLSHLLTPITELSKYNYVPTIPTDEAIAKARAGQEASLGWEKCDRCETRFQVFPGRRKEDGALTTGGKCTYHWGKLYFPDRAASNNIVKKKYRCCGQSVGQSSGCITGDSHVFKAGAPALLASLVPFVETPPNPSVPKDRAVCFDCEMGYTVYGLELLRLTATSWPDGKVLLDVLVYPVGEIIDLNSRYSGVWPEDLVNAVPWTEDFKPDDEIPIATKDTETGEVVEKKKKMPIVSSPAVARDLLFRLIAPETPLIGHGLENDLNALRIVHPTIVDTVLLYPHRVGLPVRHGLKALMMSQLNKVIQVEADPGSGGKVLGHDSAEDARAAGELVRWKVQNKWREMQKKGWTLVDGEFVPPPSLSGGDKKKEAEEKTSGEKTYSGNKDGEEKVEKKIGGLGLGGLLTENFLEQGQAKYTP